tara:strand:- start:4454 stop:5392 length:939 start_codon:yes stop_codon:yes gene_type:complete
MSSVFKQVDMRPCFLPHPAGYPYAPTHIGIDYSATPVKGARVWGVFSPYPGFNDDFENPCVVWAEDFDDYPTIFKAWANNPIFEQPTTGTVGDSSFNADPDVLIEGQDVHFTNRPVYRDETGFIDSRNDYFKAIGTTSLTGFEPLKTLHSGAPTTISPSLVKFNGKYRIYDFLGNAWNSVNGKLNRMRIWEGDTLDTGSMIEQNDGCILGYRIQPWHLSVFNHNGKLYSIVCAKEDGTTGAQTGRIYLGEFDPTGQDLYIYRKPLTDFVTYRSDAYVNENGLFVLYAAYFENDERRILADAMDFDLLLKKIK